MTGSTGFDMSCFTTSCVAVSMYVSHGPFWCAGVQELDIFDFGMLCLKLGSPMHSCHLFLTDEAF